MGPLRLCGWMMLGRNWIRRTAARLATLTRRFGAETRGNVAMIFALTMPVLVMITMGGVDINRASTVRASLRDALDTATLAAARSSATTNAEINAIGNRVLAANMQTFPDVTLTSATFSLNDGQVVVGDAVVSVKTLVAGIVLPSTGRLFNDRIPVGAHSEVNRSAKNLEVAMVLDVTGSMDGNDIASLKTAAANLVDTVVKDVQTPYTSRVSVVPYSMGVNLGAAAVNARGVTAAGSPITGATRSCSTSWSTTTCTIVVTSTGHPYAVGDRVVISGVTGMTAINNSTNTAWTITAKTANTFTFTTGSVSGTYSSGGTAWCTNTGCEYKAFTNLDGGASVQRISTCVTERTGTQAYTDASPATALVGRNYPMNETSNACLSSEIMPLSSNRTTLKARINGLTAVGSTAGHIGTAWGWYTLSPNFNSLWSGSAANAYNSSETVKAVILMTDGDFNTPYNAGVIAADALSGSGANANKINQNATNGASAAQAARLCTAMKAAGVTVYTVAFSVSANSAAATLLTGCASGADKAYSASSGTELVSAFQAIGRDITQLRISR